MCARELAGFFAAAIAQTGARDATAAKAASGTTAVPTTTAYWQQGFKHLGDPICRGAAGADSWGGTVAAGTAGGLLAVASGGLARCKSTVPTGATDPWKAADMCKAADGNCKAASTNVYYGARGALGTEGVERTYWFSLLAQTQTAAARAAGPPLNSGVSAIADPTKLQQDAGAFWLSGLFEWLVPAGGAPAPHHLMTGLWEPSARELAAGVPEGFGAVMKLRQPALCGAAAKTDAAQRWSQSWKGVSKLFALDKIAVAAVTGALAKAAHVVSALHPSDKDDCAGADTAPFPAGAFATFPRYFSPTYVTPAGGNVIKGHRGGVTPSTIAQGWLGGGSASTGKNGACVAVPTAGKWSVYRADAYRACAAANGV
jgi:hypothetical protein